MAESSLTQAESPADLPTQGRAKFIVGGAILLAAVVYLIVSSLAAQQVYYKTVDELLAGGEQNIGRRMKISGAVIGETIVYDGQTLRFTIAHVPESLPERQSSWAAVLHEAVTDSEVARLQVVLDDQPTLPDLLRDEAQAVVTGELDSDGVFYADDLLLKCPTRYDEALPNQVETSQP